MGLKKAWVYDSTLPAPLAEELKADGYNNYLNPGRRASLEEKHAELERHSLSACGDLVPEGASEWARVSVASRAHELRTRMKKLRGKSRRSSSSALNYLDEDAQRDLGLLDGCGAWPDVGSVGERGRRELSEKSLYSGPRLPDQYRKRTDSEPIVINTVDDLLRHLERIGRLQPPSVSIPTRTSSPAQSVNGSVTEAEVDIGDSSFTSQSSVESEIDFFEGEAILEQTPMKDAGGMVTAIRTDDSTAFVDISGLPRQSPDVSAHCCP